MKTAVRVNLDSRSFVRSKLGGITGRISIEVDDRAFPSPAWSDFPVVVLEWWLRAMESLRGEDGETILRFMDGPYLVRVGVAGAGGVTLDFEGDDSRLGCADGDIVVGRLQLIDEIHAAARTTLATCKERGWDDGHVARLQAALSGQCQG